MLINAVRGTWVVEQPNSSILWLHDRLQQLALKHTFGIRLQAACSKNRAVAPACLSQHENNEVWRQAFWMLSYGSRSPKRTKCWSSSMAVGLMDKGPISKRQIKACATKTVDRWIDSKGRKCYKGNANLKVTQLSCCSLCCFRVPPQTICDAVSKSLYPS